MLRTLLEFYYYKLGGTGLLKIFFSVTAVHLSLSAATVILLQDVSIASGRF